MKSWLIVLVPVILFVALFAKDMGRAPTSAQAGTAKAPRRAEKVAPAPQQFEAPRAEPAAPTAVAKLTTTPTPGPTIDPAKGNLRLAKLWNEMDVAPLAKIVASWKDEELAPILAVMDSSKVVDLLSEISQTKPERASALSKELKRLGSIVPPPQTAPQSGT